MSGKISNRGPTTAQWAHMEKNLNQHMDILEKKANLGRQILETKETQVIARQKQVEARQGQSECKIAMENSKVKIAQAQQTQAKALETLNVLNERKTENKEKLDKVLEGVKASNAKVIVEAIAQLTKTEAGLKKMKNSEALLTKTSLLITEAENMKILNENGVSVTEALEELQKNSIKELIGDIKKLAVANAAKK